jgi:hypothetical protein
MLVSPLFRNMSMHFPLLPRECVVTASALEDDREGIGPGQLAEFMAAGIGNARSRGLWTST